MQSRIHNLFKHTRLQQYALILLLLLTTAITGKRNNEHTRHLYMILKIFAYGTAMLLIIQWLVQNKKKMREIIKELPQHYGFAFLISILLYFVGQLIGALRGPSPLYSLWQTSSDGIVFVLAFLYLGWLARDTPSIIRSLLKILAIGIPLLLFYALIHYIPLLPDPSVIFPLSGARHPLLYKPFDHPNHFAYILMTGALAAGVILFEGTKARRWLWALPITFLLYGLYLTGGRGAIFGTGVGLLSLLYKHHKLLGIIGISLLSIASATFLGIIIFANPDRVVEKTQTIHIDNRSFDIFSTLDDTTWNKQVEINGGLIPVRSDSSVQSELITLQPGSYRIIAYGYTTFFRQQEKPIKEKIPSLHFNLYTQNNEVFSESTKGNVGYHYITGPSFQLIKRDSIKVEFSVMNPGIDIDPREYIYLRYVFILPESYLTNFIRVQSVFQKDTLSFRPDLWTAGIQNLKAYGIFGVGAGNANSWPGTGMHNLLMEQYGEGGILTLVGFLGWLILPIVNIKKSRLDPDLGWSIVAMMAGLMVHCIFWEQFLNGLRFLTLVYVCLWTALATQKTPGEIPAKIPND